MGGRSSVPGLADSAELAEWDNPALTRLLEQLRAEDSLDGVAYSSGEIDSLLDELQASLGGGATDLDNVPAPPEAAVTRPGDLWVLGNYRLLCGNSNTPTDLDRLRAGASTPARGVAAAERGRRTGMINWPHEE